MGAVLVDGASLDSTMTYRPVLALCPLRQSGGGLGASAKGGPTVGPCAGD